ncbi:hypothetical protein P280DRAFT_478490 [Massarina eburnea CBS 473.64]|uniref:SPX domain-containing protein n=1 Tax=Massarina eburnea CBS 473.64 TaxID=1395130 RepID=A0A6A6S855_9PLEO|nr:hypothetical protein P280DRAFT_478490 [Massarina eburnea CBS 473.64]
MKYGETLRQRSPEWGHFNIDYDFLKDQIKRHTSAGAGRAVSIPGQGATNEKVFGDSFFRELKTQHDRINLFIRSKTGEIDRRLEHIGKSLQQLQLRQTYGQAGGRLPARVIEKYAKIDDDVTKAGEEIRSLSRFQVAQRTGFRKILKKYKRWTQDRELERRFKLEITSSPDSFYQLDLGHVLNQYIEVLGALRAAFDAPGASGPTAGGNTSSPSMRISQSIRNGSEVEFDLTLSLTPLGTGGTKATYWIHPDHIVEVEVLLLQHMRLYSGRSAAATIHSPQATRSRRKSSTANDKHVDNEDAVGLLVLDHPGSFAIKENASTIGASEDTAGTVQIKAAGAARWTSSGDAAVVVNVDAQATHDITTAQLKRSQLQSFLDISSPFNMRQDSGLQQQESYGEDQLSRNSVNKAREWLSQHQDVTPIAGICSRRTRFAGLRNNSFGGQWAFLDRDVFTKASLHRDLDSDDWVNEARNESTAFPHAVLQIRTEGTHSGALLQTLDRSHLLERVRGFSLEAHAVWTCCKPEAMAAPLWMPLLKKDIRKLPPPIKRQRRKDSTANVSVAQLSPPQTSTSTTSQTDGFSSPYTPRGESSATSAPEFVDPPSLQAFRKKKRQPYSAYPPPMQAEPEPQRYWNEYDNPESEDEGYYIYIDPDEKVNYPGREFFENCVAKARWLLGIRETPDDASDTESSDDDTVSDLSPVISRAGYGTFAGTNGDDAHHESYFSGLFRTLRDPQREILLRRETERERQSLLTELEIRQHKAEMTKLRFYSTCLLMATVLNIIIGTMTTTSRKKRRGVVDFVVLFGTAFNVLMCAIAVISMKTRRERLGWVHQGLVAAVIVGNGIVDVLLVRWVVDGF